MPKRPRFGYATMSAGDAALVKSSWATGTGLPSPAPG
jgi:hypothetical protein